MNDRGKWLFEIESTSDGAMVDGLVPVAGYKHDGRPPEEVAMMEKARSYRAHSVFFEAGRNGRSPVAQALVFGSQGPADDTEFAELHKRLWSWGGVPLIYRKTPGLIQLFRCAHKPDFVSSTGKIVCNPIKTLQIAATIASNEAWWDASQLRNGTLWDDPAVCEQMLSAKKTAQKSLVDAVKQLNFELNKRNILKKHLRRKLLILSLLISYLEERGVFLPDYFEQFLRGAKNFFEVLKNGEALTRLLANLEERFNGRIFVLNDDDCESLKNNTQLDRFARLVEGREQLGGQLTLWQLYSFKDLAVELISHIYQIFVKDSDSSVYTPPFLVRLMLEESLSWERLDRLEQQNEIILDPSCGSGVFLVEAYKRLVLHWRSRNEWKRPDDTVLKGLLQKVHGIDLEEGAVELAAFSLMYSALRRAGARGHPCQCQAIPAPIGKISASFLLLLRSGTKTDKTVRGGRHGKSTFTSTLRTPGEKQSYRRYLAAHGPLPDKQLAYLFLHEAMGMLAEFGTLSMLQQYNFLYNQKSLGFRRAFIEKWDVREILDFISVRGLFKKGGADTKVIVVVATATTPSPDRELLHATFRRSGRADAEQGFDIDYFDLHWLPRDLALNNDGVWRADLLGGGRVLGFVDRLKTMRTIGQYTRKPGWDVGEGFIVGKKGAHTKAPHITGKALLEPRHLKETASLTGLETVKATRFKSSYTKARFQSPIVLIHEHENLTARAFLTGYYTYKHKIIGISAPGADAEKIGNIASWFKEVARPLQAFVTAGGMTTFTQKASWVGLNDIKALPYPVDRKLDLSKNEQILVDDIVDYYRDLIRLGEDSAAMKECNRSALANYSRVYMRQINAVYKSNPLQSVESQTWPGIFCQAFAFGNGEVDWKSADQLRNKLDGLLHEKRGTTLHVTRVARIYDGSYVFLLKPDRLRYWLRSVALRDADETLSELRAQGF